MVESRSLDDDNKSNARRKCGLRKFLIAT